MPRTVKELSSRDLKNLAEGVHFVGGVSGLTLQVKAAKNQTSQRTASWVIRVSVGSKRRNLGLGSYPEVSLEAARHKALEIRRLAASGADPVREKHQRRLAIDAERSRSRTFRQVAEQYLSAHEKDYRNEKHAKQWRSTLETYAYPVLGTLPVTDISLTHVLEVLKPIWTTKTETAKRLQGRIEKVLDLAVASGYRDDRNPARWAGFLALHLPSPSRIAEVQHLPSLPYSALGSFMQSLQRRRGSGARALEFLILTAVRSGSIRQATWDEIDFEKAEWRIPKSHTKTRQFDHRVPLTPEMTALLRSLPRRFDTNLIFPSPTGKVLSDMALNQLMRKMRASGELTVDAVPHGFRSTFRVWAAEATNYPSELAELVLMHSVGSAVYAAYQRSDLFEKRRQIMADWNKTVYQIQNNVVSLCA